MRQGKLRNLLHSTVPALAAAAVGKLLSGERTRPGGRPISRIIAHGGGRDVLDAIEQSCAGYDLVASRQVLRECGNMSSPSVLFVLEEHLRTHPVPAGDLWLASFGAGFSAHACRLTPGPPAPA